MIKSSPLPQALSRTIITRLLDHLDPCDGPINENGGYLYVSQCIPINLIVPSKEESIMAISESIKAVLSCQLVSNAIQEYISIPKLDLVRILRSPKIENTTSQSMWHHDSVGHRLKVYAGLGDFCPNVHTDILPHTQRFKYIDYSYTRFSPYCSLISTAVSISPKPGDVFIFDTNMLHRGSYSLSESRIVLELEFSNKIKSTLLPGKIGRKNRRGGGNLLDTELTQILTADDLCRRYIH